MKAAGKIDAAAQAALPAVNGKVVIPTTADNDAAKAYLAANWTKAVG